MEEKTSNVSDWEILDFEHKKKYSKAEGLTWDISPLVLEKYRQKAQNNPSFYRVFDPAFNLTDAFKKEVKLRTSGEQNIIIEIVGTTGCLSEETSILNHFNNGIKYKIEKKIIPTKSYDFVSCKVVDSLSFLIPSGEKEVFKIRVGNYFITASSEHKFFVNRKGVIFEVELKDLRVGDRLVRFKKHGKSC